MQNKWVIIGVAAAVLLVGGGFAFFLWLDAHDARVEAKAQEASGKVVQQDAQKKIDVLTDSIKALAQRADAAQQANDAKFDKITGMLAQAQTTALLIGSKQQPVIIQPGQNPQLPQGGVAYSPEQQQQLHNYEKACEDCKIENGALKGQIAKQQEVVAEKDRQLAGKDSTIKQLNHDLKRGFWQKVQNCATRAAVGATAGAVGASASTTGQYQGKPIGRAALIGGSIGGLSCLIAKP